MDDRERREMQALRDQFRELMRTDPDPPLFRKDACQRFGEMISRSSRQGRSEYNYSSVEDGRS